MKTLKIGFMVQSFTLTAGQEMLVPFTGDYVRNMGSSDYDMGIDGGPVSEFPAAAFYRLPPEMEFEVIRLVNSSAGTITAKIGVAMGDLGYDALQISGGVDVSVSSAIQSTLDKTLAVTAKTSVIAANASRRSVTIKNLDGNAETIRVGDTNTAATQGHELLPGQSLTFESEAEIFAYNPGVATQDVSILEELD